MFLDLRKFVLSKLSSPDDLLEKFEIEAIVANFFGIGRIDIYLSPKTTINKTKLNKLENLILRRLRGEPLQYILGYAHFRELKLKVGSGVLIPRPETEKIIDIANKFIHANSTIIDIGTGSGAIALSVAKEFPGTEVLGVDISKDALNYANKNKKFNNITNAKFKINDLCAGFPKDSFDIIFANLPYIPHGNYLNLSHEVKDHEPKLALTSGATGLELIEKLIAQSASVLKQNGVIILEIDKDQADKVAELFINTKVFEKIKIFKDYNNLDRFVLAQKLKIS